LLTSYIEADLPSMSEKFVYGPSLGDLMPNQQRSFIALGPTLLEQEIEVGAKFLQALLMGIQQFEQGETPDYFDKLATAEGMDPEQARTLCRDRMVEDGVVDTASVQQYIDWAVRRGYCPAPPSLNQLIDPRFVNLVQERLAGSA
jgi:ABC-type nitrate/sulfonate/bicarbonate transport system substrate-binding protein